MRSKIVMRRQFITNNIEELKNLLSKESWYEVFNHLEINSSLMAFMDIFLYNFNIAFPYKRVKSRALYCVISIQQKNASLKINFTLMRKALDYIKKYQGIYKRILREAIIKRQ